VTIDDVLGEIQARLNLEAETEYQVLEEIRGHLEEAVAAAQARGMDEQQALCQAATAFGIEQASTALHQTHRGWGTLEGVAAAGLPVLFTLVLRWLVFAPDGTVDAWRTLLSWQNIAFVAALAMLVPLWRLSRRRYVLALWLVFWSLSLLTLMFPTQRW
jgi:hypothetical protein